MFCSNCGKQIPDNTKFCNHCGAQQVTSSQVTTAPRAEEGQSEQNTTKKSKKKIIGIVLLCLQAVSILGIVANGEIANLTSYFTGGVSGIFEMLGFFLPAIIGIVLIVLDHLKKSK